MEKDTKLNIILILLIINILMLGFLKPSVEINDRDWDIKIEIEDLKEEISIMCYPKIEILDNITTDVYEVNFSTIFEED